MSEKIQIEEEATPESASLTTHAKQAMTVGLGLMALAQAQIERRLDKLVSRGAAVEENGRSQLGELLDARNRRAEASRQRVEAELNRRMEKLLAKLNLPTSAEIETLSQKVETLSQKIDELKS